MHVLALARLFRLVGSDPRAADLIERAFQLEPTRFEAARAWLIHLCGIGADERATELVKRLATDPRWSGEPFRRIIGSVVPTLPTATAAKLLKWCRPHIERDPGGLGWLGETAAMHHVFDPIPVLEEATQRPTTTADDWLRLGIYRGPAAFRTARAKLPSACVSRCCRCVPGDARRKGFRPRTAAMRPRNRMFAQVRLAPFICRVGNRRRRRREHWKSFWPRRTPSRQPISAWETEPRDAALCCWRHSGGSQTSDGTDPGHDRCRHLARRTECNCQRSHHARPVSGRGGSDHRPETSCRRSGCGIQGRKVSQGSVQPVAALPICRQRCREPQLCFQILLNADQNNIYYLVAALEEHVVVGISRRVPRSQRNSLPTTRVNSARWLQWLDSRAWLGDPSRPFRSPSITPSPPTRVPGTISPCSARVAEIVG